MTIDELIIRLTTWRDLDFGGDGSVRVVVQRNPIHLDVKAPRLALEHVADPWHNVLITEDEYLKRESEGTPTTAVLVIS